MEQSKNLSDCQILLQEKEKELQQVKADLKQMEDDKKYEAWRANCFQSQVNFLKRQSDGLKTEYANYIMQLMKTKEDLVKMSQKSIEQTYASLRQRSALQSERELIKNLEKCIDKKLDYIKFLHSVLERNQMLQEVQQEYKDLEVRRNALKNFNSSPTMNTSVDDEQKNSSASTVSSSEDEFFESSESQDENESLA